MKIKPFVGQDAIQAKTKVTKANTPTNYAWWNANSKKELGEQIVTAASFLKLQQQFRFREASLYSRLYGNMPLFNMIGAGISKMSQAQALPIDRPTMNVIQSCIDTLTSRMTQSKPRPQFLTDNGDTKQRTLAKQMNTFIQGEFYQTDAYRKTGLMFRDACVLGTGVIKGVKNPNTKRMELERRLNIQLFADPNDALEGKPTQLFETRLVDRGIAEQLFSGMASKVDRAEQAYPENGGTSSQTISDQIMLIEAWHLPSSKDAGDGLHAIACSEGVLFEEEHLKEKFPFVFFGYNPRLGGLWDQSLCEQLTGTQVEINKMLITASKSINLMGVPRVWLEDGSKVVKSTFNNEIGMIGTYRGTMPVQWEGMTGLSADYYAHMQRLIEYAYQQAGISQLSSSSQKPQGLNSGAALREFEDIQSDRFASLQKRFDDAHTDLAYLLIDGAIDIAKEEGSYQTIFPNKDGTREVDLPAIKSLEDNPFVIQCYESSSLPRDPAGRKQYVTEMMQAGILSPQEGRRLLQFPDLEQEDKLANAAEERLLKILDEIVDDGKYTQPDPYMDLQMGQKLVVQYYNLHVPAKLSESRAQMLRDFDLQIKDLMQAAMPPPMPTMMQGSPQAVPEPQPTSAMMPQVA